MSSCNYRVGTVASSRQNPARETAFGQLQALRNFPGFENLDRQVYTSTITVRKLLSQMTFVRAR